MCADAEERQLDSYAQGYVDDIRARVMRWGDTMFFSEKQEYYLMCIADAGLREKHRRERRPNWIKRFESGGQ